MQFSVFLVALLSSAVAAQTSFDAASGLLVPPANQRGGLLVQMASFSKPISAYTVIYDVLIDGPQDSGYGGLLQLNGQDESDAELFLKKDDDTGKYGIGISGDYSGAIGEDEWHRLVFTIGPLKDEKDSMRLAKFVDGELVGNQTVELNRFEIKKTWDNQGGFMVLLHDNDGETQKLRLALFAYVGRTLSDDEVKKLGAASPGSITADVAGEDSTPYVAFSLADGDLDTGITASTKNSTEKASLVDRHLPAIALKEVVHTLMQPKEEMNLDLNEIFTSYRESELEFSVKTVLGESVSVNLDGTSVKVTAGEEMGWTDITLEATDKFNNSQTDLFRVRVVSSDKAFSMAVLVRMALSISSRMWWPWESSNGEKLSFN